jgi:hypothetical protein
MDLNALMQAAMQDPAARDFIAKLTGGTPAPQVNPRAMMAQTVARAGQAPMPALMGAHRAVNEQLVAFDPMQAAQPPAPPQQPQMPPQGMGAPPPGMGAPAAPQAPGGIDLMSMLMGRG